MTIEVGQEAPDFALVEKPGQPPRRLSEFRGQKNVVLLFFPLAWSSVCTREMCSLRDDYSAISGTAAEVLAVSVDSPFALQAWAREQSFPFPLLSDFNKDVSRQYGVLYDELLGLRGVAKRAAFIIDKDGTVRYAEVCPQASELPDLEAIRRTVSELS
jgi:peroxiredoxin